MSLFEYLEVIEYFYLLEPDALLTIVGDGPGVLDMSLFTSLNLGLSSFEISSFWRLLRDADN